MLNYNIQSKDRFNEALYPAVVKEVAGLHHALTGIPEVYKTEIIISFLKYHSLKNQWLNGNKEAARVMTSGSIGIAHLEALFESGKNNPHFTEGLESYIRLKFSTWGASINTSPS